MVNYTASQKLSFIKKTQPTKSPNKPTNQLKYQNPTTTTTNALDLVEMNACSNCLSGD